MMLDQNALRGAGGGGGGGSQSTPTESPNTLKSTALARVVDIIAEGELGGFHHGLANALQDIYLNETVVMNADGSLNFQNVQIDSRTGLPNQSFMPGFPDTENEIAVNVELRNTADWTQTITNLSTTSARVTLGVPQLLRSNASNGDIGDYSISYEIDLQTDAGSFVAIVSSAINGKTTSKFQKSHTFALPAATTGWTIKVRRLTANLNLATTQDTMTIDSYAEIVDVKVRYSNLAVVGTILDSAQFSSIPSRSFDLYGRIISVPSNYDPVARTYTGTWDGTFKPAWTNNPAWIYYDAITNDRFGLGNRINAALVDKWTLYTIAQYCDAPVSNLKGGTEPRFTAFLYEQSQTDAATFLNNLTSIFRGIAYWAGGAIQASCDMPGAVDYIYTPANVIDGYFKYEGSARKTRYTVANVQWNDPADFGRVKTAYVPDRAGIARLGIRPITVKSSGATSIGQAIRTGLWTLYTSRLEDQTCTFKVGMDGVLAPPGTIIGIADPGRAGKRMGGRIHSATTTAITVDQAPDLGAAGDTLTCAMPSGITEAHPITSIVGNVITVSGGFSVAPNAEAMWYVDAAALKAATYRVISVKEPGHEEALAYTITALLHNESKFAAIDAGVPLTVDPTVYNAANTVAGPAAAALSSHVVTGNAMLTSVLDIAWDAAPGAISYDVQYRCNLGGWVTRQAVPGLLLSIPGMSPGNYDAQVRANAPSGGRSQPVAAATYTLPDPTQIPLSISNLNTEVAAASASATLANAELANIASDGILSSAEKPTVIRDYAVITAEQSGIDAQAVSFLGAGSADQVAYDNAITALTNYLATLTTPKAWNDKTGDTTVVGATFRSNFNTVYTTRQTLLNAIYAKAQTLANNAQTTANNAAPAVIVNPNFAQGLTGWTPDAANQGWYSETGTSSPNPLLSTYAVHAGSTVNPPNTTATQTTALRNTAFAPITPGEVFTAAVQIAPISTPDGYANARISWRNASQAEISVSQGNNITNATGTGTSRVSAVAPAGAVYAHAEVAAYNHTVGYYSFTAASWSYQPTNQSEVPNGGGHNSVTAIDGNGLALIDFTQTGHLNKNLGNIADTGTRFAAVQANADNTGSNTASDTAHVNGSTAASISDGSGRAQLGFDSSGYLVSGRHGLNLLADAGGYIRGVQNSQSEAVQNASFEASTALPAPGWVSNASAISYITTYQYSGTQSLNITAAAQYQNVKSEQIYRCVPGEVWSISAAVLCGVGESWQFGLALIGGSGGVPGVAVTSDGSWHINSLSDYTIPAGITGFQIILFSNNATGTHSAGLDDVKLVRVRSLDTEVQDGTTYARIYGSDLSGGRHRLTVAGSGLQVGDQRNLMPILTAGAQATWQNLTISATTAAGSPATATISVSAAQIIGLIASGGLISYNASGAGTTGTGGTQYTYYLYYLDQTLAGGTQTLQVTTSTATLRGQLGVVYIGSITFTYPTSGTGTGSGGGGLCVCDGMFIGDETTAIEARPGYLFDCLDIPTQGMRKFRRRLQSVDYGTVPCVRITTDAGAVLECSTTTPFDVLDGRTVLAPDMLGEQVVTDKGIETVARVDDIGEQHVCHIHLGGVSYAAGADPNHRIYSHNTYAKP